MAGGVRGCGWVILCGRGEDEAEVMENKTGSLLRLAKKKRKQEACCFHLGFASLRVHAGDNVVGIGCAVSLSVFSYSFPFFYILHHSPLV